MTWERLVRFFTLEAVAAYTVALGSLAFAVYHRWKLKRGRYITCRQAEPAFSHLSLSEKARAWVDVHYVGNPALGFLRIDNLSQVVIEVKNDSDTDALNDIELEFRVPGARVLNVWYEDIPDYLLDQSSLEFFPEEDPRDEGDTASQAFWRVRLTLPQLKSFEKYRQVVHIGMLADGNLDGIEMPPQGSRPGVPTGQVWTAKFVPFNRPPSWLRGLYITGVTLWIVLAIAFMLALLVALLRFILGGA